MRAFQNRLTVLAVISVTGAACSKGIDTKIFADSQTSDLVSNATRARMGAAPVNAANTPQLTLDPRLGLLAPGDRHSSYAPVDIEQPFAAIMGPLVAQKPAVMSRQMELLAERYDLANRTVRGLVMSRGKPQQVGVRVKLPKDITWNVLASMTPAEIREKDQWPAGFYPLPHVKHSEGGMVFPAFHITEIKRQEARNLARFDLDFDLPEHLLPEFPAPIYLTTRPDLGDVSRGKLITNQNFFETFNGILNPKQLDGLRLLVTPFAQQQFNLTEDRRSEKPILGVTCFDCHANGHTNAAFHLVGDVRPQSHRRRIDTPTLRGVNMQRLFGSQRALRTVEDFTEFEQRAAYFDGDPVIAQKKGVNILERGSEVHAMAEFQELLDFPPAPKLRINDRKLDPALATPEELRGEAIFFGKGQCATCHPPPIFSDNFMHDLGAERFFKPKLINGRLAVADGPIKSFPLRGIKDSPPYLHDGRLLTLEDTVEFFNLILALHLTDQEKTDLVAYMRAL